MTLDWKSSLHWLGERMTRWYVQLGAAAVCLGIAMGSSNKANVMANMLVSGMCLAGAVYNPMIYQLLKSNRELMAERRDMREAMHAMMQMRVQEIGEAIAEDMRGIMNVEVRPTKVTKH